MEDMPIKPSEVLPRQRIAPDGQTMLELPLVQEPINEDGEPEYDMDGSERLRRAIMLRLAGSSFENIARTLGYASGDQAMKAVNRAMKAVKVEATRQLKNVHHMRLEHMLMLLWPSINQGDLTSMAMGMQVLDRIERLHGLQYVPSEGEGPASDSVLVVGGEKQDFMQALEQAKRRRNG